MRTNLRKLGNSTGAIIPAPALDLAGFKIGDELDVVAVEGQIIIKPTQPTYTMEQLLAGVTDTMVELDDEDKKWLQSTIGAENIVD